MISLLNWLSAVGLTGAVISAVCYVAMLFNNHNSRFMFRVLWVCITAVLVGTFPYAEVWRSI